MDNFKMDKVTFYTSFYSCLFKEYSTKLRLYLKLSSDSTASEENKGSHAEKVSLCV